MKTAQWSAVGRTSTERNRCEWTFIKTGLRNGRSAQSSWDRSGIVMGSLRNLRKEPVITHMYRYFLQQNLSAMRDQGLNSNGLRIFTVTQNLWDFALDKKKEKQNQKFLLRAVAQREPHSRSPTTLSSGVTKYLETVLKYIDYFFMPLFAPFFVRILYRS